MRLCVVITAVCLWLVGLSVADDVYASIRKQINIPAEGLGPALQTLAKERNFQIVYVSEEVNALQTQGAIGEFTPEEALSQLLKDTGLTYRIFGKNAISIIPVTSAASAPASTSGLDTQPSPRPDENSNQKEGKKSFWDSFRLAQANQGTAQKSSTVGSDVQSSSGSSEKSPQLTEILVTAQKREQRLQDVPIPVTVLDADALVDNGRVLLRDYASSIPSLSVIPGLAKNTTISMRGITTGGNVNPTVGITIDDVPYGGTTTNTGGNEVPDIDPGDLARIEVLRGPQGTLYGAASMGGLIKYVTKDPSTDEYSGRIEAGTSGVYNGAEPGFNLRASANIPISDTLAVRVSGYTHQDPGYIDNPVRQIDGVNEQWGYGGRWAALWTPTSELYIKLSALYQHLKANGLSEVNVADPTVPETAGLSGLQQNYLPGMGAWDRTVQAYSATLKYRFGDIELTSLTGYNINDFHDSVDFTSILGSSFTQGVFGVTGTPVNEYGILKKVTQEFRLAGPIGQHFDWLVGGFYTHERGAPGITTIGAENSTTGQIVGQAYYSNIPITYEEIAAFADLTYHVMDRIDIQVGARQGHNKTIDETNIQTGPLTGLSSPTITPEVDSTGDAFTYLVTPSFRISPDLMVYARLASGYRPGGPNPAAPTEVTVPIKYNPDKTYNYELGVKGDFLDHRLSVDASVYYIDWKNIQIQLVTPDDTTLYQSNGSRAKSEGIDLAATVRPLTGLTISGWLAYDDAVLTEAFPTNTSPPTYGVSGDRLPNTSKWSGHLSAQQDFPLGSSGATGFVGAQATYLGDRVSIFQPTSERQIFPAYTQADLRAGVRRDSWLANFYVNNVTDARGVLQGGLGFRLPFAFSYIQPRTVGLSLVYNFGSH